MTTFCADESSAGPAAEELYTMHSRLMTITVSTIAGCAAVVLGMDAAAPARAAAGVVAVPCSPAALAAGITSAENGQTLRLAPLCSYELTAALPAISQDLTIQGTHATIER